MTKLFISHSSKDDAFVRGLQQALGDLQQREGLVSSAPYSERPPRVEYRLTPEGRELGRALEALAAWGLKPFPGTTRTVWPAADRDQRSSGR